MKICILQTLHRHDDKRMFHKVAKSLVAAGHEVVSVVPCDDPNLPDERDGVRFRPFPEGDSLARRLRAVWTLVRMGIAEHAEVYVAPEPESWVAALIVKARGGGKVVLDMHEHIPTEFAKFFPRPLQPFMTWLTVKFMRLFARHTDLIILTRDSFEDSWTGLPTPRVTVINTNHLQPPCTEIPAAVSALVGDRPVIIHQGIFGDVRGSYQLLDAMKILTRDWPTLQCLVLGNYVYGSEAAYRAAIAEAGLQDNLVLIDAVPFEDVPAYIAVSQVGLILFQPGPRNHTLAMPHKLFDYMREGVPVVVPEFAVEVRKIVQEGNCGTLVDVTRPEEIAKAIHAYLSDPAHAREVGARGRALIETRYNWQADERRLIDAFNTLEGS